MQKIVLLVVDDEEEIRENIKYDLRKDISFFLEASNGLQALEAIKSQKVDVVLTDINMPGKNGLEFATAAREWGFSLPIIFLTAHGDNELKKQALDLKAYDFIDKPYDKQELIKILSDAARDSGLTQQDILNLKDKQSAFEEAYLSMINKNQS